MISGIIVGVISEALIGLTILFIKYVDTNISFWAILSWKNAIALSILLFLLITKVIKVDYKKKNVKDLLLLSAFQPVLYGVFATLGIRKLTACESGILSAFIPIITAIFGVIFLKDKPTKKQVCFILMSVSGVIISTCVSSNDVSGNIFGIMLFLLGLCCEAAYAVFSQKITEFTSPEKTIVMTVSGTVFFGTGALVHYIGKDDLWFLLSLPFKDTEFGTSVLYLGIVSGVIGFLASNYVLKTIGATRRATIGGVATITAVLSGIIVLKERIYIIQIIAIVLIIIGVYGVNKSAVKKMEDENYEDNHIR